MSHTESTEIEPNYSDHEENEDFPDAKYPSDRYKYSLQCSRANQTTKTDRSMSYNGERSRSSTAPISPPAENNRFRHLYSRFKRRFSISKDYRTRTDDVHPGLAVRLSEYKSFSSSMDDSNKHFQWPDFEHVYDSIPHCLLKALPGLDSFSPEDDDDDDYVIETIDFNTEENDEQMKLFEYCKRGRNFRRNALCQKLDKNHYHGQLDTFIQQVMIEKLMRTWT